jgi:hypothetical protein
MTKGKIINIFANTGLKLKLRCLLKSSHGTEVTTILLTDSRRYFFLFWWLKIRQLFYRVIPRAPHMPVQVCFGR